MQSGKYFKMGPPKLHLRGSWNGGIEATFSVSYRYNGGIVLDENGAPIISWDGGEWYDGYKIERPVVHGDFELVGMGVGLQLNARPPYATQILRRKDGERFLQKDFPR